MYWASRAGNANGAGATLATEDTAPVDRERRYLNVSLRRQLPFPRWAVVVAACSAQVLLAVLFREARILTLPQAAVIGLTGLYSILARRPGLFLLTLAYLSGAEILWRQTTAPIFYMSAPYLVIALSWLMTIVILRNVSSLGRRAALYVLPLLPAAMITISVAGDRARQLLPFALAGPIALGAAVTAMSQFTLPITFYRRLLWTIVISAYAPWGYAVREIQTYLATAGPIDFSGESNFVTSGGFGPVQVSSLLSFGALAAILLVALERETIMRLLAGLLGAALLIQSLLTFSRGGIYSLSIAVSAFLLVSARNPRARRRVLTAVTVALVIGYVVVLPQIEQFTAGAFAERFSSTETPRSELASSDLQVFLDHAAFGAGPGMGKYQRIPADLCEKRSDKCANEVSSHTEFTRAVSEHGVAGIASLLVLFALCFTGISKRNPSRLLATPWIAWGLSQMAYANLRIVAVPLAFGMAFLHVVSDAGPNQVEATSGDRRTALAAS